jgi:hypothetical protein
VEGYPFKTPSKDSKQSKGVDINGKKAEEQDIQKDTEVIRLYA